MKTVGLRELKNNLSRYVRAVRKGETVVVTDRGEPVVQLSPVRTSKKEDPFAEMVRRGEMTPGRKLSEAEKAKLYAWRGPPVLQGTTSAEILDALREETLWRNDPLRRVERGGRLAISRTRWQPDRKYSRQCR